MSHLTVFRGFKFAPHMHTYLWDIGWSQFRVPVGLTVLAVACIAHDLSSCARNPRLLSRAPPTDFTDDDDDDDDSNYNYNYYYDCCRQLASLAL